MWTGYDLKLAAGVCSFGSEYGSRERGKFQDRVRLSVRAHDGTLLAYEGEPCGIVVWVDGERFECPMPVTPDLLRVAKNRISWRHDYATAGVQVAGDYEKLDAQCLRIKLRFRAVKDLISPHFSWGINMASGEAINNYHWTQSPTQMSYSFKNQALTLWMLNDHDRPARRFSGCQALVAEHPDPQALEFHVRTPPGYAEVKPHAHVLKAGQTAEIMCVLALRPGWFYEHKAANAKIQPLEKLPSRYPYKRYVEMAVAQFMDQRKYHAEDKGIMYYTAVDGTPEQPQFQDWTQGPGWGGAWEVETAWGLLRYATELAPAKHRARYIRHARNMLDGFLSNPKFRVPAGVQVNQPGDMKEAMLSTYWFPDMIWTGAQADFMLHLSHIYELTQWNDCREAAKAIGTWVLRHQAADGTIPTLWQFPVNYSEKLISHGWRPEFSLCHRKDKKAEEVVGYQPASSAFLVLALLRLWQIDPAPKWHAAAMKLLAVTADRLEQALPEFGNGELDYLVYNAKSMDPTGLSYIIQCLAEAFQMTKNARYENLLCRYTDTLLAYGVTFDWHETLLRPKIKTTLGDYQADIRLAGGMTHANWRPIFGRGFGGRFNLLMNRNEMADALLAAWQATRKDAYREWVEAYANWQTYFQFLGEVKNSPIMTKGSCPQNHFWTTDFGNWNNDYATTAQKWVGSYLSLMKSGLLGK